MSTFTDVYHELFGSVPESLYGIDPLGGGAGVTRLPVAPLAGPNFSIGTSTAPDVGALFSIGKKADAPAADKPASGGIGKPADKPAGAAIATSPATGTAAPGTAGFIAQHLPYAQAAVQQAGATLDPAIAVAVAANETGYGTTGGTPWNSLHGIRGVGPAGQTPGGFRAYATPQESYADFVRLVTDPNGRYAPAYQGYQQSRDAARFIQDIAAAGYALAGPEAQAWVPQVQSIYQQVQNNQPWVAPPAAGAPGGIRPGVSQNALGLDAATAAAICGPAAAIWFAQNFGRNPSVGEAMELAKQSGWTQQSGMAGPQSQVRLLQGLGVPAQLMAPDPQAVAREIQAGRPVILSSPGATGHYFQVTDYNPASGEFQFGDAVGRGRWATLDRVGQFGYGQPDTAIVVRQ